MEGQTEMSTRKRRKEEGRRLKKQRIEQGGGVRPRGPKTTTKTSTSSSNIQHGKSHAKKTNRQHRFGRVMDSVPCRNKPRTSTLSIAIPGSVVSNCQTRELKTQLVGQIARAATIYHVDEIIVFDDKLSKSEHHSGNSFYGNRQRNANNRNPREKNADATENTNNNSNTEQQEDDDQTNNSPERQAPHRPSDPHAFMARVLQYCECPQYLRRHFFPVHPDLQFAGLLAPMDAPHHVRAEDRCKYREGVVLEKTGSGPGSGSLVNCGIRGRPVEIDARLTPGIRCTVEIDSGAYGKSGQIKGRVVSPSAPREEKGMYWGYTTRLASSIKEAIEDCPFEGGYDLKIGTSERGSQSIEGKGYSVPAFNHCLIVFGGVAGIEECVDADESIKLPGSESQKLFDQWVNICPFQGSRTIRTEEAVLITLAKYSPLLAAAGEANVETNKPALREEVPTVHFTDDEPSDESSEGEED